jgi:KUP system potassium uptake protein
MRVLHTASQEMGQIYIPAANWLLAIGTLEGCHRLQLIGRAGGAYGIAVSMLMAITTVLAALVALQWGYNLFLVLAVSGLFLIVDLIFVAATATKLLEGGWFPTRIAA